MTDPRIAQAWVQNEVQAIINTQNNNAMLNYQNVFNNWSLQQIGNPPTPPQLTVLNQALAVQLYTAWSNALAGLAPGAPVTPLDLTSAISFVQAAAIQLPPPVVLPAGQDEVGPLTGNTAVYQPSPNVQALVLPTAYTVAGDTSPLGTHSIDSRGEFVKIGAPTPFGISSQWVLLPAEPTPTH